MTRFTIITAPAEPVFGAISKVPDAMRNFARPSRGKSMGDTYPAPLDLEMSDMLNPTGIQVADVVPNAVDFLIVSDRLKQLLASKVNCPVEYLEFRLLNHKGRVAAEPVWVVNVLGTQDCADRARSEGTDSPFRPGTLFSCGRLALDPAKVPSDPNIFRTSLFPALIFVREDLRAAIEAAGMSARFVEPGAPL